MEIGYQGVRKWKKSGNHWYRVLYIKPYKQSCGQNSGAGSKHVEDIKKIEIFRKCEFVGLYCIMKCTFSSGAI